ncbi:MAG: sigma-70 family RNA polymerase sigma factor [Eubacteriales bacterium]|nr:sigma-70 family RNA polymerase sigma factor [Eubacteriales bacterium]
MKQTLAERFTTECQPYASMVYRHCLHMLKRPEEAEDAAQESMLRAFRSYERYRGDGTATWLYRIAHNTCLDVLKSSRVKKESLLAENAPETPDVSPNPEEMYIARSRQEALWAAVSELSIEQQTLLNLFYGDGMSYQEMAAATGLAEGTIKSRLSRAKDALRGRWNPDEK